MKRSHRWGIATVVCASMLVGCVGACKLILDAQFFSGYDATLSLDAVIREQKTTDAYRREEILFTATQGSQIPALMVLPHEADSQEPAPCIIFLHGIGQNKEFLDEIAEPFTRAGFAMITFDQYMRGERRLDDPGPLDEILAFRQRGALTVIETRRVVDYLETRADIDAERIYLVGASYGAITGSTAVALEPRIQAVVLVYGGGNMPSLMDSPMIRDELGAWAPFLIQIASWYLAPADPIQYVHRIAPRPILFQHGRADSVVPPESAKALYEAAREPKTFYWYEGDHIGLDEATVREVLNDALEWLQARDAQVLAGETLTAD